eukprot:11763206-Heterocapsa_arctica.AAC.1
MPGGSASSSSPAAQAALPWGQDATWDVPQAHDMGQQDYWDARDGAYTYEDYDDFSESATSGEVELPESLPVYLAGIPVAEHGEHLW